MASFGHQVQQTIRCNPRTVLEIGVGSKVVTGILRACGLTVTTLDHDEALRPDVVGCVTRIPLQSGSFDLVLCCEVLEHLPYEYFKTCLEEIHRVTTAHLVLSLPDVGRYYAIHAKLPKMRMRRIMIEVPKWRLPVHQYDGEHFWEIGTRGCPLRRIRADIESVGFAIEKCFRVWENPYHRMFVARRLP